MRRGACWGYPLAPGSAWEQQGLRLEESPRAQDSQWCGLGWGVGQSHSSLEVSLHC